MLNHFKSTQFKIRIARFIYLILKKIHLNTHRIIRRNDVFFEVDISEVIDLSLFLSGNFQKHIIDNALFKLSKDAVIFDVGANIGSISLFLANQYSLSTIYAFEPTNYAYAKLQRNIQLNSHLEERIKPVHTFISDVDTDSDKLEVYSSWRLDTLDGNRHPVHLGIPKKATIKQTTLDNIVSEKNIPRLDFIKIDTDGNELKVLKGAIDSLKRFNPIIVFELMTYVLKDNNQTYSDFEKLLIPIGYQLLDVKSGIKVTELNINKMVPKGGSIDIVALPTEKM